MYVDCVLATLGEESLPRNQASAQSATHGVEKGNRSFRLRECLLGTERRADHTTRSTLRVMCVDHALATNASAGNCRGSPACLTDPRESVIVMRLERLALCGIDHGEVRADSSAARLGQIQQIWSTPWRQRFQVLFV